MLKKILQSAMVLTMAVLVFAAASQPAEAYRRGFGPGLAIGTFLGLGIAGAYAGPRYYGPPPGCYLGPRQCDRVGQRCWHNSYGEYVCRGGEYRCWRPTICD